MAKTNILIPDADSGHALVVARCFAGLKDFRLHIMAQDPTNALRYSTRCHSFTRGSLFDQNGQWLDKLVQTIRRKHIDIVLPIDEPATLFISTHLNEIEKQVSVVPVPTVNTFETATNKWYLYRFLSANNIPCPDSQLLLPEKEQETQLAAFYYPALIKPCVGHGGKGIFLFRDLEEAVRHLAQRRFDLQFGYLLQRYIEGYDIDCSLLAKEGKILAYTIQKGFIPRSSRFAAPAGVHFLKEEGVMNVVKKTIDLLQFTGIAHIDLRYDLHQQNYKIVEINARYWGSLTASLLAGVNFPYLACQTARGKQFGRPDYRLNKYIDHTTALKLTLKKWLRKHHVPFKLSETDLPYIIKDPLAETLNIFKRWYRN